MTDVSSHILNKVIPLERCGNVKKILFAASEAAPFAHTGGLGDVMGALPPALRREKSDWDVRVVLPLYPGIRERFSSEITYVSKTTVHLSWRKLYCGIWKIEKDNVTYYFIDNEYYFRRPVPYGAYDDGERFAFFGLAVLELMGAVGFFPDVLIANDWQAALSVVYLKLQYARYPFYDHIKTLFVIHNIAYQGRYGQSVFDTILGLPGHRRSVLDCDGDINYMKAAIALADRVVTVSPRYAGEILTDHFGRGMQHILRSASHKLSGILNGIDTVSFNPETDSAIPANFTVANMSGKKICKSHLQSLCGMPSRDVPLIVMVTRLAKDKGIDLVQRILYELLSSDDVQFVLLGTGEWHYEDFFRRAGGAFPDKTGIFIDFNTALSRQIYAGADIFLMPSATEACGLAQMIAMRYGTLPLVRETGGLADTVSPYNQYEGSGNGFSFANYNAHEMLHTIRYATGVYQDKEAWTGLCRRAMASDFSWGASAREYGRLIDKL
ncbi:MAG: glycogen synthase GlgA [Clostridiales bacterium]|jgi:starch synthase|nr:glycogen synthase GlgA [Clostridiales bacterium]